MRAYLLEQKNAIHFPKRGVWQNFDRMNRIYFEWRLNSESVFHPVIPVHPVKMSSLVAAGRAGFFSIFRGYSFRILLFQHI